jgi:hypothetical protein
MTEDEWLLMTEDCFYLRRKNVIIDVGWYPDGDPTGDYVARLVIDQNWEKPRMQLTTKDPFVVFRWLKSVVMGMGTVE